MISIPFTKAEALGNDFIILNIDDVEGCHLPKLTKSIAHRRYGVGCDQVLFFNEHHVRFFNADGTEAEACGNGSRAFALFLAKQKKLNSLIFQTASDNISAQVTLNEEHTGQVNLSLASPKLLTLSEEFISDVAWLLNDNVRGIFHISTGNPHLIIFVNFYDDGQFNLVAPQLASALEFSNGVNVSFAIIQDNQIHLTVLERGAGRTPACGTAAFAAAFAATNASLLDSKDDIKIVQDGGVLVFSKQKSWHMQGPARLTFTGQFLYYP